MRAPPGQSAWDDQVYLSVDPYLDLDRDHFLGKQRHTGGLAAGGQYTVAGTYKLPHGVVGPHYVFVVTDPLLNGSLRGSVFETEERNNATPSSQPVIIDLPPPADAPFVLRAREPEAARPFRALGYPIALAVACLTMFLIVINALWTDLIVPITRDQPWGPAAAGLIVIGLGLPIYFLLRGRALTD